MIGWVCRFISSLLSSLLSDTARLFLLLWLSSFPVPKNLNDLIIVALLHHVRLIPNREEKLASGALLTGLAVMGVNLQFVSNMKD